jgi:N-alpha-acetyltransferase 38, NatC auxiliary subunit
MSATEEKMDKDEARGFLNSLLNKKLRIHTTDERMFWGEFKCTDPVSRTTLVWQAPAAAAAAARRGHTAKSL